MKKAMRWATPAALVLTATTAAAQPRPPQISVPEVLAIELPAPGVSELAPTASPLRELLEAARLQGQPAAHNVTRPLRAGTTTAVTWSATDGSGRTVTRTEPLHVFPFGQAPVGVSRIERATGGNNAPKIARDAEGKVHMVWLDAGRPGTEPRVLYRRASTDPQTGAVTWETDPLMVSTRTTVSQGPFPALRISKGAVHIAWAGPNESTKYRRLVRTGTGWTPEAIRDTRAPGGQWDKGPGLDVRGDDEIHVISPSGRYAFSKDGGTFWSRDALPRPPAGSIKGPALAVDALGNSHVVYTVKVRSPASWSSGRPNRAYWELRYARRAPDGTWAEGLNVLAGQPGWAEPTNDDDVLADWPDIAVDGAGNVHVGWHGTANTHIYGRDEAFYARRPATGPGAWGAWEAPQLLFARPAGSRGHYSFAPSLSVDTDGDVAFALTFADLTQNLDLKMDSMARMLRGGRLQGAPVALSTRAAAALAQGRPEAALAAWFPMAAPRLYVAAPGRVWLDVLQNLVPHSDNADSYIVYQRVDVSALVAEPARR